jgi:hypothetical protein
MPHEIVLSSVTEDVVAPKTKIGVVGLAAFRSTRLAPGHRLNLCYLSCGGKRGSLT